MTMTDNIAQPTQQQLAYDRTVRDLLGVASLWMLTTTTAISFCRIFSGWGFLTSYFTIAAFAHLASFALRRGKVPFFASLLLVSVSSYALLAYLHARQSLTNGLPLGRTWSYMWQELSDSWQLIGEAVPPLALRSGFGFVGLISLALIAFLADSFAFRFAGRVEALIPSTIVFVVVSSVGIDRNRTIVTTLWAATAIAAVAVLRLRHQLTRSSKLFGYRPGRTTILSASSIVIMAVVASLIASIAGPRIPGATEESWLKTRSGQSGAQLDPLVDIRGRLSDPTDQILFSVAAEFPSYWRVTSLPTFDGNTWTVSQDLLNSAAGQLASLSSISEVGVAATEVIQLFTIQNLAGTFAPVADRPTQLRSATRSLFYEPESGTLLVSKEGLKFNDNYQIVSTVIVPSAEALRISSSSSPPDAQYLRLPQKQDLTQIQQIVDQIIEGSTGNYEKLLAIQSYFRNNFAYSLDVPASTSAGATMDFLTRKSGYCEQFSSTFALFARLIGIPSRVAIGFTPGEASPIGTSNVELFNVRSQHAHAWPEVWFDGIGWVLFEPTPGRGAPSADYTNVAPAQDDSSPSAFVTTTTPSIPTTTTVPITPTTTPSNSPTAISPATTTTSNPLSQFFVYLAIALALIALWSVTMPLVVRALVLRREKNEDLVNWRGAIAQFEAVHGRLPQQLTVREIGDRFIERDWDHPEEINQLVEQVTLMLFSPHSNKQDSTSELLAFVTAHAAQLPWQIRALRRLSPRLAWKLAGGGPQR
jgi:transglutaminase-like putative cysteine protease